VKHNRQRERPTGYSAGAAGTVQLAATAAAPSLPFRRPSILSATLLLWPPPFSNLSLPCIALPFILQPIRFRTLEFLSFFSF